MAKQRVLLTGASGSMGHAAFRELLDRRDAIELVLILRPSPANKKAFRAFDGARPASPGVREVVDRGGVEIVWGDVTRYEDVRVAVRGVDAVLHAAALISPEADRHPERAAQVNVGGTENLVKAILAEPGGAERIRLVNVGSVAMYGDRLPPVHMLRTGDPIQPSVFDRYAITKARAERIVAESGIRRWCSLRQTYIAIPDTLSLMDPILFHQPLDTRIELITAADAGYGMARCLDMPDEFFGRAYNMGGGPKCRVIYRDYMDTMMKNLGMGDFRAIMELDWFCLRNFHCGWFEDSDTLNRHLGHWRQSLADHYTQVLDALPWYVPLGKLAPSLLVKELVMKRLALQEEGPLHWVRRRDTPRVTACYGGYEQHGAIGGWASDRPLGDVEARRLDHGYDETKALEDLSIDELRGAAEFRGGVLLSDAAHGPSTRLRWRCAFGHEFEASPALVLKGGHWCLGCLEPPWHPAALARKNRFFAQSYYVSHDPSEDHRYDA